MKLFVRSIPVKRNLFKVDLLDLSDYKYAEIYKIEISIDKSDKALFYNITTEQKILSTRFDGGLFPQIEMIYIPAGYYTIQQIISIINSKSSIISLITSEANKYHCKLNTDVDFLYAKELQQILGYNNTISNGISDHCVNITRGLNVLQIYSSIVNSAL